MIMLLKRCNARGNARVVRKIIKQIRVGSVCLIYGRSTLNVDVVGGESEK